MDYNTSKQLDKPSVMGRRRFLSQAILLLPTVSMLGGLWPLSRALAAPWMSIAPGRLKKS